MSIQGLWTTEMYGLHGWENSGVMVLERERALGGGRNHFAIGTYQVDNDDFSLSLLIEYHGEPRVLFGSSDKQISLNFVGRISDGVIEGSAFRPENPKLSLTFRLTKRAEL